jgi:hypothetical protein
VRTKRSKDRSTGTTYKHKTTTVVASTINKKGSSEGLTLGEYHRRQQSNETRTNETSSSGGDCYSRSERRRKSEAGFTSLSSCSTLFRSTGPSGTKSEVTEPSQSNERANDEEPSQEQGEPRKRTTVTLEEGTCNKARAVRSI